MKPETGHAVRWQGTFYPLRFADVELTLDDGGTIWQWRAIVGFSAAPIPYVLLGYYGFLEFMDATFRGDQHILELETNASYPGTVSTSP